MIKKAVLWIIALLIFAALAAGFALYQRGFFTLFLQTEPAVVAPPALPDTAVAAGIVKKIAFNEITIQKQDQAIASFSIASSTALLLPGEGGKPGEPIAASAITIGSTVLITPVSTDPKMAHTIMLVPPPPAQ